RALMAARIVSRRVVLASPWMRIVEKAVEFEPGVTPETYHCVSQSAYVGVLAQTPEGLIPIVNQYRPSIEDYTWEFPAGTVDETEDPESAIRRELREEAGLEVEELTTLASLFPDTGRLQIESHCFYARTSSVDHAFQPEPGMRVRYVTHD